MTTLYILFALSEAKQVLLYYFNLAYVQLWAHTIIDAHNDPSQQKDQSNIM